MSETERALHELATSTAEALAGVLETFLPGGVGIAQPEIVPAGTPAAAAVEVPAIAAEVAYTDGASGGNWFVAPVTAVRKLAQAMMGMDPVGGEGPLDGMERSAFVDAMHQMMAAAANATGLLLGEPVDTSSPEVHDLASAADAAGIGDGAPHVTAVTITVAGEPCRLVQLMPKAFVLKMTRALDERAAQELGSPTEGDGAGYDDVEAGPDEILRGVPLRVCAEIGRATMPVADAVQLPPGGLVELDRGAEEPVDVLVNGRRFATGRLVLVDDEWAVRIEQVLLGAEDLQPATPVTIERS